MDDKSIHGYTIVGKWVNGARGGFAYATKNGKKYSLKKYTNYSLPTYDGMYDEKTLRVIKEKFDSFVETRRAVINPLASVTGLGGSIVIPCDNFVDNGYYYEATEFIDGVISDDEFENLTKVLSKDEILMLMKIVAGALSTVHLAGIIHSNVTLRNIILVRNEAKNIVAKLKGFEHSYPEANKKHLGFDDVYCSPELAEYADCDDEEERLELIKKITSKTDIFSLGVVYHYYLSGEFPQAVKLTERLERQKDAKERAGKRVFFYPNYIVSNGCELKLSDKITSENMRRLLLDMMNADPDKRPTALQVLSKLKMIS